MAGRVSDRDKDRLMLLTRAPECIFRPLYPMHRIILVLTQVGRERMGKVVLHGTHHAISVYIVEGRVMDRTYCPMNYKQPCLEWRYPADPAATLKL